MDVDVEYQDSYDVYFSKIHLFADKCPSFSGSFSLLSDNPCKVLVGINKHMDYMYVHVLGYFFPYFFAETPCS